MPTSSNIVSFFLNLHPYNLPQHHLVAAEGPPGAEACPNAAVHVSSTTILVHLPFFANANTTK